MNAKLFFLGLVALVALSLQGCAPRLVMVRTVDENLFEHGVNMERMRDLEMENAALKAANSYLRDTRLTVAERESLVKGREDLLEMERLSEQAAKKVDAELLYRGR